MGRPKKVKSKSGRKVMDGKEKEVVAKLEQAYAIGCSDVEACVYAGIDRATLFRYQKRNPEFRNRKEYLKAKPILQARQTVVKALATDANDARWFLTKKLPQEFGDKQVMSVEVIDLGAEAKKRSAKYLKE